MNVWKAGAGIAAAGIVGLVLTGCGSGTPSAGSAVKPSAGASASSAPAAASSSVSPSSMVPTLAVGQSATVRTFGDGVTFTGNGTYRASVLAVHEKAMVSDNDGSEKAAAGHTLACVQLRVKNVSSGSAGGDLYPFAEASWLGADGALDSPPVAPAACGGMGIGTGTDDMSGEPDPGPGETVTGTVGVEVPMGSGSLVFEDRQQTRIFTVSVAG
jgi:hypothetical protein